MHTDTSGTHTLYLNRETEQFWKHLTSITERASE